MMYFIEKDDHIDARDKCDIYLFNKFFKLDEKMWNIGKIEYDKEESEWVFTPKNNVFHIPEQALSKIIKEIRRLNKEGSRCKQNR